MNLLLFVGYTTYGQTPDSMAKAAGETLTARSTTLLDSINSLGNISRLRDSVKLGIWSDSVTLKINDRFAADSLTTQLKFDSLSKLGGDLRLRQSGTIDSLRRKRNKLLMEAKSAHLSLSETTRKKYLEWNAMIRSRFNLDSAGIKTPGKAPDLPSWNISQLPEVPGLESTDFSSLSFSPQFKDVTGNLSVPSSTQLLDWNSEIPRVSGLPENVTSQMSQLSKFRGEPQKEITKIVAESADVGGIEKNIAQFNGIRNQAEEGNRLAGSGGLTGTIANQSPELLAAEKSSFEKASGLMNKYKKKFPNVEDISKIPKNYWLPQNGLKGKPFRERIRFGFHIGARTSRDTTLIDLFPNVSYRFTGRIEAGLGLIYTLRLSNRQVSLDQKKPAWGTSTFVVFKTFKSTFLRVEVDATSIERQASADGSTYRDWRWSFLSGIQTNFKLGKQFTGNVQMLYNFDRSIKDAFPEALTMRVGVQHRLKDNRNK